MPFGHNLFSPFVSNSYSKAQYSDICCNSATRTTEKKYNITKLTTYAIVTIKNTLLLNATPGLYYRLEVWCTQTE
jgi:hypothetical protein